MNTGDKMMPTLENREIPYDDCKQGPTISVTNELITIRFDGTYRPNIDELMRTIRYAIERKFAS